METLNTFLTILKVALGIGFVIFIHELGHFFVAKWNGVKVEKFSIGFGPTLLGFRRGETEYVLAAIPLGGFVKMLGEGPESEEPKSTDPRAYPNKSVSARMTIISAGVLMNLLFGGLCFAYFYGQERMEVPAVLGAVEPGSPAYEAGLIPGDEIVAIDGRRDLSFQDLLHNVVLSSDGQVLHFEVKRPGRSGLLSLDIQPPRAAGKDRPTIGIGSCSSLMILDFEPPTGMANPPAYPRPRLLGEDRETKIDVLVAAGPAGLAPQPLADIRDYERLLAKYVDRPITHVIERRRFLSDPTEPALDKFEFTLPPNYFVDFGLRFAIEPIRAVRKDSPADQAGFRKGDLIVKVNGRDDFDPMQLPMYCFENAGKPMSFEVQRTDPGGERTVSTLTVTPDDSPPQTVPFPKNELFDVPGIGVCYAIATHVLAVRPDSPAARAGLKPRDVINAIILPEVKPPATTGGSAPRPALKAETIELDEKSPAWFSAFTKLQDRPIQEVELVVNKASNPKRIKPAPDSSWCNPARGLEFLTLFRKRPPQAFAAAVKSGFRETMEHAVRVYATIRALATRRISFGNLAGPVEIVHTAYKVAGSGLQNLIYFLGFLSVNLAVLNFLPIPPLDGGQMAYLLAEKVRGRPLPDSAMIAGIYVGFMLLICLMVFVTYQDVFRLVFGS